MHLSLPLAKQTIRLYQTQSRASLNPASPFRRMLVLRCNAMLAAHADAHARDIVRHFRDTEKLGPMVERLRKLGVPWTTLASASGFSANALRGHLAGLDTLSQVNVDVAARNLANAFAGALGGAE